MKKLKFEELEKDLSVARHFMKLTRSISKTYIPLIISASIFKSLAPFINIIMPKFILDELMGEKRVKVFVLLVSIVVLGNAVFILINRYFDTKLDIANLSLMNGFELHLGKHIMNMDFESLEDPNVLDKKEKALYPINVHNAISKMINNITILIQTIITLAGLVAIVSTLNIFLIIIIITIVIINSFIFKKSQETQFSFHQKIAPINRQYSYHYNIASDFSMAKDIRIYNMSSYIIKKIDAYNDKALNIFSKMFRVMRKYEGISNINLQVQMFLTYSYMVWKVLENAISIGDFTMYISAANSFSTMVSAFLTQFIEFRQMCRYLDIYLQFESIKPKCHNGKVKTSGINDVSIEFKNVWFKYPHAEEYTLKDVSIIIKNGEKLSVVGQNGAGKTTFIKLLCRLYEPEKGQILVNGIDTSKYDFNEYIKLLSVVFQDYKFFPLTIKENMVFDRKCDENNLNKSLEKVGILRKVLSLPKGIDTFLYKNFDKKGVELSGGEMQKLAIARAIYKNSPIVVLDEPTSALDPYSEYEIYSRFNELIQNKTSVYISHRLSSCKFCDKIAVFDKGELIEYGTHIELERLNGKYSEMWHSQAQYYI